MRITTIYNLGGLFFLAALTTPVQGDQFTEYLNGRTVRAIVYDDQHDVVWLGTNNDGLFKFDGATFTSYHFPTYTNTRAPYNIESLALDHQHNLWVGTNSLGVGLFNVEKNAWEIPDSTNQMKLYSVKSIAVDLNGGIWFGTSGGAVFFDGKDWFRYTTNNYEHWNAAKKIWESRLSRCKPNATFLSYDVIFAVAVDQANKVWFGTQADISVRESECVWRTIPVPAPRIVKSIVVDRDNLKWFGTEKGLYKLASDDATWEIIPAQLPDSLKTGPVYAAFMDYEGNLWFGRHAGVARFDRLSKAWRFTTLIADIDTKPVTSIAADEDGDLWFGSFFQPARAIKYAANWFSFSPTIDDSLSKLTYKPITALTRDQDGRIWLGNQIGIGRYDSAGWKAFIYFPNENHTITEIAADKDETLWLAGSGSSGGRAIHIKSDGAMIQSFLLGTELVNAVTLEGDFVWFGTNRGLRRCKPSDATCMSFTKDNGLIDNFITALAIDWQGRLWCGTTVGVSRYDGKEWKSFTTEHGLVSNKISAITVDHQKHVVWFATPGGASSINEADNWSSITVNDGLFDNFVADIEIFNERGEIWFATAGGASCRNEIGEWINYTKRDGLAENNLVAVERGAKSNELWFGTDAEGVTRYRRPEFGPNTAILTPVDVVTQSEVIFRYRGNDLNTSKGLLRYSYKLDGDEWSPYTFNTLVSIPVAQNGPHTFYVKAIDQDKNEDLSPATDFFYKIDPDFGSYTRFAFIDSMSVFKKDSVIVTLFWPPHQVPDTTRLAIVPVLADTFKATSKLISCDFQPYDLEISKKGVVLSFEFPQIAGTFTFSQPFSIYRSAGKQGENESLLGGTQSVKNGRINITTAINQFGRYVVRAREESPGSSGFFAASQVNAQPRIFSPRGGGHGPQTNISFNLEKSSNLVKIKVYNLAGRFIKMIFEAPMNAGVNAVVWDGRDYNGSICPTGLYLVMIESDVLKAHKKVMIVNE